MIRKFLLIVSLCFIYIYNAQNRIDKAIENLETNYSQEKVYLLLDKSSYLNGEDILFKSFVFEGYRLSSISTTLFVELYDHDKKLLDKKTVLLKNGEGDGSFSLDENLLENVYFIRAYTPWMANFPEAFQSIQSILIYNPNSTNKLEFNTNKEWTAEVFPESGTFIENIPSKFAIRLNHKGSPADNWSGYIIDKDKPAEKITQFKNLDENVASFMITPQRNKEYQALIEDSDGTKQVLDLPSVSESGVSFQVNSTKDGVNYKIKGIKLAQNLQDYRIVGTTNNRAVHSALIKKPIDEYSFNIEPNVNEGLNAVLLLSVFNERDMVVAERLVFINPDQLKVQKPVLKGLPLNSTPRTENQFEIPKVKEYDHYSVLIKNFGDSGSQTFNNQNTILSTLWLTGDLTSKIENPAQYFLNNNNSEALDALLISEKWKRFDWKDLLSGGKPTVKYKPQTHLSYKGKLALNSGGLASTTLNLLIQTGDSKSSFFQTVTDEKGYFFLENIISNEPLKISYFLNADAKNKVSVPTNLTVAFQPIVNFVPLKGELPRSNYHIIPRTDTNLPQEMARALTHKNNKMNVRKNEILIEEVLIKKDRIDAKSKLNKELSSGKFSSMNAVVFDFVNENQNAMSSSDILQWLQGRAAGLSFRRDSDGTNTPFIRGSVATIYLDEFPVDANILSGITIGDIAMVKIIKGGLVGNAIAIYLRKGNMASANEQLRDKKNNTIILNGYDKAVSFSQPVYKSTSDNDVINDTRDVLYWNPSISYQGNFPIKIEFINNDLAKKFKVMIIGFNEDGIPLFYDETLE